MRPVGSALRIGLEGLGRLGERELLAGESAHEPAAGDDAAVFHAAQRPLQVAPAHGRVLGGHEVVEHDAPPLEQLVGERLGELVAIDVGGRGRARATIGRRSRSGRRLRRSGSASRRDVAAAAWRRPDATARTGSKPSEASRPRAMPSHSAASTSAEDPAGGLRQLAGEARAPLGEHLDDLGQRAGRPARAGPRRRGGRRAATAGRRGARATPAWCGWRRRRAGRGRPARTGRSRSQVTSPWWHRRSSQAGS